MISGIVIAAETENRSFQFGNFEVIAVQDALSAMRFELFPGMPEEEFLRLTGASISFCSPICTATTSEDCLGNMAKPFFPEPSSMFPCRNGNFGKMVRPDHRENRSGRCCMLTAAG